MPYAVKSELPARRVNLASRGLADRHMKAPSFEPVAKAFDGLGRGCLMRKFCDRIIRNDVDLGAQRFCDHGDALG